MRGPPAARERMGGAFWRFWSVEVATETGLGLAVIALQTMVVLDLGGGATEVGWLSSARFLPYVVLGLLVGALVEGMRRRTVMLVSDVVRALVLGGLAAVWLAGGGALWVLLLAAVLLGAASLVNDAASQAFVPRLVDRARLLPAHQRLDAGSNAAQSAGPAVSGAVIAWLGAPVSLLAAAAAHLVSAACSRRSRSTSPRRGDPPASGARSSAGCASCTGIRGSAPSRAGRTRGSSATAPR
ncbi:MFS transporter [Agrococcus sediminis]|uniref:MFS transporter n=1 Tax=Agrococcus sediminis TaxID=2599924 RepID=A0A5M8QBD8_9MICO|nr:MFS transporter [Agrococcus sediminis]KAA6432126.1 MFS transporter [Agrococcus sediminis]